MIGTQAICTTCGTVIYTSVFNVKHSFGAIWFKSARGIIIFLSALYVCLFVRFFTVATATLAATGTFYHTEPDKN